jgi:alanine racemase
MKKYRTWSEINLKTVGENIKEIKSIVKPAVKILVVVKADAYGHGAISIGRTSLESGASCLGVGDSTEAIELRQAGILDPIIILGAMIEEEIGWIISYDIIPTIHSMDLVELLNNEAIRQNKKQKVHLKIDTGLSRLGASPERAVQIVKKIKSMSNLELEGICSHFSSSFNPDEMEFTKKQVELFNNVIKKVEYNGFRIPLKHIASTGAVYTLNDSHFNLVRLGGAVYGIDPGSISKAGIKFKAVLSLKSQITFLKTVPAGTAVGYHRSHITSKPSKIATIPIGYNDGYPYQLGNKGHVLIQGKKAPIIGTITMDYIMADITQIPEAKAGDEVVLIGQQGKSKITAEELAKIASVSPYVITCGLGKRVKRMYVSH